MSGRFHGKVALITGGTSGIGAGTVRRLASEGAKVVFTGSNAAKCSRPRLVLNSSRTACRKLPRGTN